MARKYLGPSATLDGKPVPADGLTVNYSDAQLRIMRDHGHRFSDDEQQVAKPTPAAVNEAVVGETTEADLAKAVKASKPE